MRDQNLGEEVSMAQMKSLPEKMRAIVEECISLGQKKNNDYAGAAEIDNISLTGIDGISVRLLDKACRVRSLTKVIQQVVDERMEDTLRDMINYAAYGILLIRGQWGDSSIEKLAGEVEPNDKPIVIQGPGFPDTRVRADTTQQNSPVKSVDRENLKIQK